MGVMGGGGDLEEIAHEYRRSCALSRGRLLHLWLISIFSWVQWSSLDASTSRQPQATFRPGWLISLEVHFCPYAVNDP